MKPVKIVVDSDFGLMNDDCIACLLAHQAADIDLVGVTIVAGNHDLGNEVQNALSVLEHIGADDVPVCAGFADMLVHARGPYEDASWGGWNLRPPVVPPFARPAERQPDPRHAVDFIVEQALAEPGSLTLVALGPLTNVAVALRKEPRLVEALREIVLMGGAVTGLPGGEGNVTPTAEFNVWADAEAARIVLSSGARVRIVPLNATRRLPFEPSVIAQLGRSRNPGVAALFTSELIPRIEHPLTDPDRSHMVEYGLCDSLAVTAAVHPELLTFVPMFVDVELAAGPGYGTLYAYMLSSREDAIASGHPAAWSGFFQPAHLSPDRTQELEVAVDVDVDGVVRYVLEAFLGEQAGGVEPVAWAAS